MMAITRPTTPSSAALGSGAAAAGAMGFAGGAEVVTAAGAGAGTGAGTGAGAGAGAGVGAVGGACFDDTEGIVAEECDTELEELEGMLERAGLFCASGETKIRCINARG